jgi:hypothetical protein
MTVGETRVNLLKSIVLSRLVRVSGIFRRVTISDSTKQKLLIDRAFNNKSVEKPQYKLQLTVLRPTGKFLRPLCNPLRAAKSAS